MRTLIINLLATALLLFSASSASAMALYMTQQSGPGTGTVIAPSDILTFDIYLDADPGLEFLTVAVLYDDDGIVTYNPGAFTSPTYLLYTGGKGTTYLTPLNDHGQNWNGFNQPGKLQVQASSWYEKSFGSATASGNGIWISTLVFHVAGIGDGETTIELTLLGNGSTIIHSYTVDVSAITTTTGTFVFTTVPEPSAALLGGAALVTVGVIWKRRNLARRTNLGKRSG
jgi:hypothetical protein